jgi:hypothetical protein
MDTAAPFSEGGVSSAMEMICSAGALRSLKMENPSSEKRLASGRMLMGKSSMFTAADPRVCIKYEFNRRPG